MVQFLQEICASFPRAGGPADLVKIDGAHDVKHMFFRIVHSQPSRIHRPETAFRTSVRDSEVAVTFHQALANDTTSRMVIVMRMPCAQMA